MFDLPGYIEGEYIKSFVARLKGVEVHSSKPAPCTLNPTPYTLHPAPYTLNLSPYTLHPAPCTLHPAPYTLHSQPCTVTPISQAILRP